MPGKVPLSAIWQSTSGSGCSTFVLDDFLGGILIQWYGVLLSSISRIEQKDRNKSTEESIEEERRRELE